MSGISIAFLLLIQAGAGLIIGLTSFGGNLFSIPLMSWIVNGRDAIVIGCLAFAPFTIIMPLIYYKHIIWKDSIVMGITGLIGAIPGTWLLARIPVKILMLLAAGGIILFLAWQIARIYLEGLNLKIPVWASIPCGFIGGIISGTIGMGGPPVVFYTYLRGWDHPTTVGSLSITFFLANLGIFYGQWAEGLYTPEVIKLSLYAAVGAAAGFMISIPIARRVSVSLFRKMVLGMLSICAVILIWRCLFL